ncbi:MAG: hypothetical protein JST16_14805 [Bdellovibrionales bacterium]|nr:hypothetical protein [Bdellovibrionales bacterium]
MRFKALWVMTTGLLATSSFAASNVRLQPVAQSQAEAESIGGDTPWALSLGIHTVAPLSTPFALDGNNFRYQTSNHFALEVSYRLTSEWEVGVASGYEIYETRRGDNDSAAGEVKPSKYTAASLSQFPVEGIVRYRMPGTGWVPEAEAGLGMGFGTLEVSSTNTSDTKSNQSVHALRGHVAAGAGFPWNDGISLHAKLGYAFEAWGSDTVKTGSGNAFSTGDVTHSSLSGFFAGADFRINF